METAELHSRMMDDARRYDPATRQRDRLAPYRDVLLTHRANGISYEDIAATLTRLGLKVSHSGVGIFCRKHFSKAEILRRQRELEFERTKSLPPAAPAGKRGPKIARDDY